MVTVFSHLRKNIAVVRSESVITAKFTHSHTQLSPSPISLSLSLTHILVYTVTFRGLGLYHFYWFSFHFFPVRVLGVFDVCWRCKTNANRKTFSVLYIAYPFFSSFTWLLFISKLFSLPSVPPPPLLILLSDIIAVSLYLSVFSSLLALCKYSMWNERDLRGGLLKETDRHWECVSDGWLSLINSDTDR